LPLETRGRIISNGAFINFKILRKIPVRVNGKMVSEKKILETIDDLVSYFKP